MATVQKVKRQPNSKIQTVQNQEVKEDDIIKQDAEAEANHDEDDQVIETYANYLPSKLRIGKPHPDPVVETSSLSTVEPPDISYKLKLPSEVIDNGLLSALQLESVIYASQQHETFTHNNEIRRGFLIGDGAGVGKGRTIAGIIYENYMRGRKKAIWFSVSPDLKFDAERDLKDLGAKITVHSLNTFGYEKGIIVQSGVIFSTYSSLLGKSTRLKGPLSTRIGQLTTWAGEDFDGIIVFDESHKAKSISLDQKKGSQSLTATLVLELQERLPKARVVYASATGASETHHLGYMTRLGLWGEGTPYGTFSQFYRAIERRGVGAMELVAVDLKMRGSYIARQLSFEKTQFTIRVAALDDSFVNLYDECVDMWAKALKNFREAEEYFGDTKPFRSVWTTFWGAHQKFFKYLCIGSKVPLVVEIAKQALEDGKCVVIGLQSTGESKTNEALKDGDINEFVSTSKATFKSLVEDYFPAPQVSRHKSRKVLGEVGNIDSRESENEGDEDPMINYGERLIELKCELLDLIDKIGPKLPNNTLDDLIDCLGGPSEVAELTGRKGRIVKDNYSGKISYKCRNETDALDRLNIAEKDRFMSGQKLIAIISEAASSGVSLQADRRVKNQLRRVHITIELPWSADRAIQQFGRTHRSNQVSGPEYVFVISELAGEKRFASIVAKRLESLGALTHGDRRANTETRDLSQFNIVGRYCKQALEHLCYYLEFGENFAGIEPQYEGEDFLQDAKDAFIGSGLALSDSEGNYFGAEPKALDLNHFLNRLLGMKVRIQNAIFNLFTDYMKRLTLRRKVAGLHDSGILELNTESGKTRCSLPENFYLKTKSGTVKCTLHNVQVERGITWDEAMEIFDKHNSELKDKRSGFYCHCNPLTNIYMVYLLVREPNSKDLYRCYRPNTGRQGKPDLFSVLRKVADKLEPTKAKKLWCTTFDGTDTQCIHMCLFKACKRIEALGRCDVGLRHLNYCIMSGGILTSWPYLEEKVPGLADRLQIVRLKLDAGNRVIGPVIPQNYLAQAKTVLKDGEGGVEF